MPGRPPAIEVLPGTLGQIDPGHIGLGLVDPGHLGGSQQPGRIYLGDPRLRKLLRSNQIPPSRHPQIAGFTARARRQAYAYEIRLLKEQYGYDNTPITINDPGVLADIADNASAAATSIINGYNQRLMDTLDNFRQLEESLNTGGEAELLTADDLERHLQTFYQSTHDYNQNTLIPFQLLTARQQAIHDFMVNNGIQALYTVEPDSSVSPDTEICQMAVAISNATDGKGAPFSDYAELPGGGFMGSEHPNCPHLLVPQEADPDTLPAPEDLWDASQGPEDVTTSADMGDASEKGFVGFATLRGFGVTKYNHEHDARGRFASSSGLEDPSEGDSAHPGGTGRASQVAYATMQQQFFEGEVSPNIADEARMYLYNSDTVQSTASLLRAAGAPATEGFAVFGDHPSHNYVDGWNRAWAGHEDIISEATRQVFGLPESAATKSVVAAGEAHFGDRWKSELEVAKQFVTAQYKVTQDAFAELGYKPTDTVDLYRGYTDKNDAVPQAASKGWVASPVTMTGATSWSTSPAIARSFVPLQTFADEQGYVAHVRVQIKDILSTGFTGMGVSGEQEMVVIGRPITGRVIAWKPGWTSPDAFWRKSLGFFTKYNHVHGEHGHFASTIGVGASDEASMSDKWKTAAQKRLDAIGVTRADMVKNMEADFLLAQPEDAQWYNRAYQTGQEMKAKYGVTDAQVYGILAALSPMRIWQGAVNDNVAATDRILAIVHDDKPFTVTAARLFDKDGNQRLPGYKVGQVLTPSKLTTKELVTLSPDMPWNGAGSPQLMTAVDIARGADPAVALGNGPKVRSFFNNLSNPDASGSVTLDAWMFRSAIDEMTLTWGDHGTMTASAFRDAKNKKVLENDQDGSGGYSAVGAFMTQSPEVGGVNGGLYPIFADAVRAGAALHGLTPQAYQAMVWQGAHREEGRPT